MTRVTMKVMTTAAVDGVGHTTVREGAYRYTMYMMFNELTQIHNSSFIHSSTVVSSDSHIVYNVVGDSDLC